MALRRTVLWFVIVVLPPYVGSSRSEKPRESKADLISKSANSVSIGKEIIETSPREVKKARYFAKCMVGKSDELLKSVLKVWGKNTFLQWPWWREEAFFPWMSKKCPWWNFFLCGPWR